MKTKFETNCMGIPLVGSRWQRKVPHDPAKGPYNGYTVTAITNTANHSDKHPPQVVYVGDNGNTWSRPLADWPGSLTHEIG